MVVEIPTGTRAKLEISHSFLNPIKQDTKNGKLRYVHDPYPFNYGAFPQTWENPLVKESSLGVFGDNDPVDAVEIGGKKHNTGEVIKVKILGVYAMIDDGEADWKIICIDVTDGNAFKMNSVDDIPKELLDKVFCFLRDYKIPDGKPPNKFGFDNKCLNKDHAVSVLTKCHDEWRKLICQEIKPKKEISISNTELDNVIFKNNAKINQLQAREQILRHFSEYLTSKL